MNTFANGGVTAHSAPQHTGNSPGPPFHVSQPNLSMEVEPQPYSFVPSQKDPRIELPNRQKSGPRGNQLSKPGPHGLTKIFDMGANESSEMDTSPDASADLPTPSTTHTQSRHGSSSVSSFTPPQQQDDPQNSQFRVPRPSPKAPNNNITETNNLLPRSSAAHNTNFYPTSDDLFPLVPNFYTDPIHSPHVSGPGFIMPTDWEISNGGGTGMTPISDGGWNQILDNINLGWDSIGPPHGNEDLSGRRLG